ncbi:MAG: hypothetical protein AAFO94_23305, partial [Bacteroidota bacterium]
MKQQYDDTQDLYLRDAERRPEEMPLADNVIRLLVSSDESSALVGIEMLKAGGVPSRAISGMLVALKTTDSKKVRDELKKILLLNAPDKWKVFINDRISFKVARDPKRNESDVRKQLRSLEKRLPKEQVCAFARYLFEYTGKGLRYILTLKTHKEEREKALAMLIDGAELNYTKGLNYRK